MQEDGRGGVCGIIGIAKMFIEALCISKNGFPFFQKLWIEFSNWIGIRDLNLVVCFLLVRLKKIGIRENWFGRDYILWIRWWVILSGRSWYFYGYFRLFGFRWDWNQGKLVWMTGRPFFSDDLWRGSSWSILWSWECSLAPRGWWYWWLWWSLKNFVDPLILGMLPSTKMIVMILLVIDDDESIHR